MKRGKFLTGSILLLFLISIISAGAGDCLPSVSLVNQDPYPANPDDYVDLVFQVSNINEPDCGEVSITLLEEFPFSLDIDEQKTYTADGYFQKDFGSFLVAPYEVRVSPDALDGENLIDVLVTYGTGMPEKKTYEFNITVEDNRAEFEIFIKDYEVLTNTMTLEILNTGKYDIEALTIEIPKQDSIQVKGANRNIVGDLDSNDYTTAEFEATLQDGTINLELIYTDGINVRRTSTLQVTYESEYFVNRAADQNGNGSSIFIVSAVILAIILFWLYRRSKKKKRRDRERRR